MQVTSPHQKKKKKAKSHLYIQDPDSLKTQSLHEHTENTQGKKTTVSHESEKCAFSHGPTNLGTR
jgi:hypothetical protein